MTHRSRKKSFYLQGIQIDKLLKYPIAFQFVESNLCPEGFLSHLAFLGNALRINLRHYGGAFIVYRNEREVFEAKNDAFGIYPNASIKLHQFLARIFTCQPPSASRLEGNGRCEELSEIVEQHCVGQG